MRLWHKDLIQVLPRQQLLSQWRECCGIASNVCTKGSPKHLLVDKVMDFPVQHFISYTCLVVEEMERRGYNVNRSKFEKYWKLEKVVKDVFPTWHNNRYLRQCFYNLQEKYDCGGIVEEEWRPIKRFILGVPTIPMNK